MAQKTPFITDQLTKLQDAVGYGCIRKDRTAGNGEGVAIVYKMGDWCLQQIKTGTDFEIVAVIGRRTRQRRKLVTMAAYIPPSCDADTSDLIMQKNVDLIGTYKRRYNTPCFLLGGDFNKRNIKRELRVYNDLKLIQTPPTRGTIRST